MNILTFTTLWPNAEQPNFGVFVKHRLAALAKLDGVNVRVVAPVPYFPRITSTVGKGQSAELFFHRRGAENAEERRESSRSSALPLRASAPLRLKRFWAGLFPNQP